MSKNQVYLSELLGFWTRALSGMLKNRKHDVSETIYDSILS
jgi:hypothetical protein